MDGRDSITNILSCKRLNGSSWLSLDEPSKITELTIHKYGTGSGGDRLIVGY